MALSSQCITKTTNEVKFTQLKLLQLAQSESQVIIQLEASLTTAIKKGLVHKIFRQERGKFHLLYSRAF